MKLVAAMPEQIRSPKLTAQWENSLLQIEKGHLSPQDFMGNVVTMITNLVQDTRNISESICRWYCRPPSRGSEER